jgi:hypothetical protein
MTLGKFLVRTIAVFVATFLLGFLGHGTLLHHDYLSLGAMMRTEADGQAHFPWMLLGFFIYSAAIVWMYSQGNSGKPWLGQGFRFGAGVWAIASVPMYLINYAVAPWPGKIIVKQVAWDFVAVALLGILIAALSKNDAVAQPRAASA